MAKRFAGFKKWNLIVISGVLILFFVGGYLLYRGGYIFADTDPPLPAGNNNFFLPDLSAIVRTGAARANSGLASENQITERQYFQEILNGRNSNVAIDGQITYVANSLIQDYFPEDWSQVRDRGADYNERGYEDRVMNYYHAVYQSLRRSLEEVFRHANNDNEKVLDLVLDQSAGSAIAAKAEAALATRNVDELAGLAEINAPAVAGVLSARITSPQLLLNAARGEDLNSNQEQEPSETEPSNISDIYNQPGQTAQSSASEGQSNNISQGPGSANNLPANNQTAAEAVNQSSQLRANLYKSSNFAINPYTGRLEYVSRIQSVGRGGVSIAEGQIWWDPFTGSYSGRISADYEGYRGTMYANARTGDVYFAVSRADQEAIKSIGGVKIMEVQVGRNGRIGGKFQYQNRLFYYNPESRGFEIPVAIGGRRMINFMSEQATNEKGEKVDPLGVVYFDSKGNVHGKVDLPKNIGGSLFIDRNGTITYGRTITKGGTALGSVFVDSTGNFGGQIGIDKVIGTNFNLFVGLDRHGFTGASVPIGSFHGAPIFFGVDKDGGLTISGEIGGVPITIGQDAHGNFNLGVPFIGNIKLFGHENRPLWPPQIATTEDGNTDASCIYFRHSFKKLFKVVRVYQVPCTKIEKEEQMERGSLIFDVYNQLLGRNPSIEEFTHWYFYGGHQLYEFPRHETDKAYRMEATRAAMNAFLTCGGRYDLTKGIMTNDPGDNCNEYKWIKAGKPALDAPTRPKNIMKLNPFDRSTWNQVQNTTDSSQGTQTASPMLKDFIDQLETQRQNDPGDYLGDYYEKVAAVNPETARANVDLGNAKVETVPLTRSGDYPVIERFADNTGVVITLRKGLNEVFAPKEVGYLSLVGISADGIKVFEYDSAYSGDPRDGWRLNPQTMKPGTGYYIYNQGDDGRKIVLRKAPSLGAGENDTVVKQGWNLLVNSSPETIFLGDYSLATALSGWSGGCDIPGLCVQQTKIADLLTGDSKSRAYKKISFLVPDDDPLKIKKLVEVDVTEGDYLKKVELKQGQMFWLYLFE